jgi:polynucleotide 5'-kinase involved in rRNA processing
MFTNIWDYLNNYLWRMNLEPLPSVESSKSAHIETDTIFLIGVTASGKSTLANMLALKDQDFTIP